MQLLFERIFHLGSYQMLLLAGNVPAPSNIGTKALPGFEI